MWAQLITARLKPGADDLLPRLVEQLHAAEQPDSGLVRSTVMQDQNDPSRLHMLVVMESEERAHDARPIHDVARGCRPRGRRWRRCSTAPLSSQT